MMRAHDLVALAVFCLIAAELAALLHLVRP